MSETPDIVSFIRERLDEDEQIAKAAEKQTVEQHPGIEQADEWSSGNIYMSDDGTATSYEVWADEDCDATVLKLFAGDRPTAVHIARYDPARMLRGVEAKRRIADLHNGGHECSVYDHRGDVDNCHWCLDSADCSTMRLLASEWSDHAEYRQEWTP